MTSRKLYRCFDRRFRRGVIAGAAVAGTAAGFGGTLATGTPARLALAVIEGLGMGWVVLVVARSLRRLDELELRIHLQALSLAFGVLVFLGSAWSYLEHAGLPRVDCGAWLWLAACLLWWAALVICARRYR